MFELFKKNNAAFSRGVGLLLVLFVFYGTTIEAAHRHGRIAPSSGSATALDHPERTSTPLAGKSTCSDCLICQLHQNFNTTLITFRLVEPPIQPRVKPTATVPRDVLSQVTGPTSDRAPPFIS
jgi:hypothetical protein